MFQWICPECGRPCPPTLRECPDCALVEVAAWPAAAAATPVAPAVSAAAPAFPERPLEKAPEAEKNGHARVEDIVLATPAVAVPTEPPIPLHSPGMVEPDLDWFPRSVPTPPPNVVQPPAEDLKPAEPETHELVHAANEESLDHSGVDLSITEPEWAFEAQEHDAEVHVAEVHAAEVQTVEYPAEPAPVEHVEIAALEPAVEPVEIKHVEPEPEPVVAATPHITPHIEPEIPAAEPAKVELETPVVAAKSEPERPTAPPPTPSLADLPPNLAKVLAREQRPPVEPEITLPARVETAALPPRRSLFGPPISVKPPEPPASRPRTFTLDPTNTDLPPHLRAFLAAAERLQQHTGKPAAKPGPAEPPPAPEALVKPEVEAPKVHEPEPAADSPVTEPSVVRDAVPEPPEPVVVHATPEPVVEAVIATPESAVELQHEPEPVATLVAEPEPVATFGAEPEPVATLVAEPEPIATFVAEPEPEMQARIPVPAPDPIAAPPDFPPIPHEEVRAEADPVKPVISVTFAEPEPVRQEAAASAVELHPIAPAEEPTPHAEVIQPARFQSEPELPKLESAVEPEPLPEVELEPVALAVEPAKEEEEQVAVHVQAATEPAATEFWSAPVAHAEPPVEHHPDPAPEPPPATPALDPDAALLALGIAGAAAGAAALSHQHHAEPDRFHETMELPPAAFPPAAHEADPLFFVPPPQPSAHPKPVFEPPPTKLPPHPADAFFASLGPVPTPPPPPVEHVPVEHVPVEHAQVEPPPVEAAPAPLVHSEPEPVLVEAPYSQPAHEEPAPVEHAVEAAHEEPESPKPEPLVSPLSVLLEPEPEPELEAPAPLSNFAHLPIGFTPAKPDLSVFAHPAMPLSSLPGPSLPAELEQFQEGNIITLIGDAKRRRAVAKATTTTSPGWLMYLSVFVIVSAVSLLFFFFVLPRIAGDARSAPTPVAEAVTTTTSAGGPQPVTAKYIELTGIRLAVDATRKEVHYLVVNHGTADIADVTISVTIKSPRVGIITRFSFKLSSLGPLEAKEFTSEIDTTLKSYEIPDWKDIRADYQLVQ